MSKRVGPIIGGPSGRRTDYQPGDKESEAVFLQRNSDFHLSIATASGNDRLIAVLNQTLVELERMFHLGLSLHDRGSQMHSEHQSLIDALAEGDAATAERLTIDQMCSSRGMVLDALLLSASLLDVKIGVAERERFL